MINEQEDQVAENTLHQDEQPQEHAEKPSTEVGNAELESLQKELTETKEKYMRMYAEFDNFRKRSNKDKLDLIKTAGEEVIASVIPVIDDFERALKALGDGEENKAAREGIELVYHKLLKILTTKGLKPMNAVGEVFNPELHEAITQIPAPSEDLKGKIVDEIEKGYYLHEKVIRFAKVVTGA